MSRFFVSKKGTALLNVQMNEFPEGHVKVPSWEFVHFAHCQKLLACQRSLKRNNPSCHKYLPKKPFEQKRQNNRELFNRGC